MLRNKRQNKHLSYWVLGVLGVLSISALCITLGWPVETALAHLGSTKYIDVSRHGETAEVIVHLDVIDAAMQMGPDENSENSESGENSEAKHEEAFKLAKLAHWLAAKITLTVHGKRCRVASTSPRHEQRDGRDFLAFVLSYTCVVNDVGAVNGADDADWILRDDSVFDDDRQHESIVHVEDREDAHVLRYGKRTVALYTERRGWQTAYDFLVEGVLHFLTGYDHILFLLSLLLPIGFLARIKRTKRIKHQLKQTAKLVTAFTVGHSVTLMMAVFGWVVLPSRPVEVAIALSIVVVAMYTAVQPKRAHRVTWTLALLFGLIHGFGFSSVLAEIGLPKRGLVLALFAFNLGIEIAQLGFVLVLFYPLMRLARSRHATRIVRFFSAILVLIAMVWVYERVG